MDVFGETCREKKFSRDRKGTGVRLVGPMDVYPVVLRPTARSSGTWKQRVFSVTGGRIKTQRFQSSPTSTLDFPCSRQSENGSSLPNKATVVVNREGK